MNIINLESEYLVLKKCNALKEAVETARLKSIHKEIDIHFLDELDHYLCCLSVSLNPQELIKEIISDNEVVYITPTELMKYMKAKGIPVLYLQNSGAKKAIRARIREILSSTQQTLNKLRSFIESEEEREVHGTPLLYSIPSKKKQ